MPTQCLHTRCESMHVTRELECWEVIFSESSVLVNSGGTCGTWHDNSDNSGALKTCIKDIKAQLCKAKFLEAQTVQTCCQFIKCHTIWLKSLKSLKSMESFWSLQPSRASSLDSDDPLLYLFLTLVICFAAIAAFAAFAALAISFRKREGTAKSSIAQCESVTPLQFCHDKSQLVIFDFDNVLTTQEVTDVEVHAASFSFAALKKAVFRPLGRGAFGGEQRLGLLDTFLQELSQYANLGIVSRNSRKVIRASLSTADLLQYFPLIFGAEDFEDLAPKSKVISDLVTFHNVKPDNVLFIDDMFLNVSDVSQHCHVATLHIRTPGGIDCWDCEYILAWARSRHADNS